MLTKPSEPSVSAVSSLRFRIMTLPRSSVLGALVTALLTTVALATGVVGCRAANAPETAGSVAPPAPDAKREKSASKGRELDSEPLTLLADLPTAKAQPSAPVSKQGWLGVALGPDKAGVRIDRIVPGSPSEKAGLERGDVISSVAGEAVYEPADVVRIVARHEQGERLSIGLQRDGAARLLAVELAGRPVDMDITRMSFVGQPAPELGVLRTVKGSVTPTLQALRGKVVVLEFWASWCSVCRFMVPTMNEWQARFGPQGAVVLGVTVDSVPVASNAANQLGMDYPLVSDQEGEATRAYAANSIPALYIIDQKGTVREVIIGYSESRLAAAENLIDTLLDGS